MSMLLRLSLHFDRLAIVSCREVLEQDCCYRQLCGVAVLLPPRDRVSCRCLPELARQCHPYQPNIVGSAASMHSTASLARIHKRRLMLPTLLRTDRARVHRCHGKTVRRRAKKENASPLDPRSCHLFRVWSMHGWKKL